MRANNELIKDILQKIAFLNKIEVLPWDCWGIMSGKRVDLPGDELAALDHISEITVARDSSLMEIRTLYGVTESD